jgi:hypothetical protein
MQSIEQLADEIRAKWKANGCPPCDHTATITDRMRYGGGDSGDRVCKECGAQWYLDQKPAPEPGGCSEQENL